MYPDNMLHLVVSGAGGGEARYNHVGNVVTVTAGVKSPNLIVGFSDNIIISLGSGGSRV